MFLKQFKRNYYVFVAVGLNLLFFHPVIFSDKTFFFRDIHRWFYPMKSFLANMFKAGEIPFWCSSYFCGSPFMSDIQSGVFYPLSIIFLLFPFPLSFNIYVVFHFFLGFCFFYLFIASLGLSRKSALLTSISYCYGGYVFATVNTLNNLSTAIWLPAILWSFNRARLTQSKSGYCLTVIFLSLAILGGEPQLFILITATLFFYAVTSVPENSSSNAMKLKYGMVVVLMVISAVLITMVQLGQTFTDYQHSARLGGLTYEEASRFSLSFAMLNHLLLPLHFSEGFSGTTEALRNFFPGQGDMPWLLTIYPGVIIFPLAILGTICSFSKRNFLWLIIFFMSILFALGDNTLVHYLFYKILPIFRFPEKFMFLAGFSMLVMAAHGFDNLMNIFKKKGVRSTLIFLFLATALTLDLYSNHRNLNPVCGSDFYDYHHSALQPIIEDQGLFRVFADKMPTPQAIENSINNHHVKWQMMLLPNLGILENLYHVGGIPALELRYQHQITEILTKSWKERIHFLKLANVKYIISQERLDREPDLKDRVEKVNGLVYRISDFFPRAWVVGEMKKIERGTVNELTNGSFDPSKSALGRMKIGRQYDKPFSANIDQIDYQKSGDIHIEVQTDKPGILIISESSYPGWKVYVDGREKECLWLDLLFMGVEIGPGRHDIVFKFCPKHFNLFLFISLVSLLLLFSVWALFWIKGRFKPSSFQQSRL